MSDEELVRRMQQGDMQAFDMLYERYKNDAYRVACLITGSRTDGEDLTQEAFVIAAQSIGSLRDGTKFAGAGDRAHARRDRGDGQIPPVFRPPPSAAGADRKRGEAEGGSYKWMKLRWSGRSGRH